MRRLLLFLESATTVGPVYFDTARRLGFEPILLAAAPQRYSFADGTTVLDTATDDLDNIYFVCRHLEGAGQVCGLMSTSDYFVLPAAKVARRRRLPGPDPDAIALCRDKHAQRQALSRAGVPGPAFRRCITMTEVACARLEPPVVLKPVDGSGSVGVRLCRTYAEVEEHASELLEASVNERGIPSAPGLLMEEFVEGPEYSAEVISGRVVAITGKHLSQPPAFVETGHDVPPMYEAAAVDVIEQAMEQIVSALSLGDAPAHIEFRVSAGRIVPIEVNPRVAGGHIATLVALATGVDLVEQVIRYYCGLPVSISTRAGTPASVRFQVAARSSVVVAVGGVEEALRSAGVVQASVTRKPGDRIQLHGDFRDRVGYVIAKGATSAEAAQNAECALARMNLRLE